MRKPGHGYVAASFRPFFLGAAVLAAAAVPTWLWLLLAGVDTVGGMPALRCHAHEMALGYLAAAIVADRMFAGEPEVASVIARLGIAVGALLIAAAGGRLVPSLTLSAFARQGQGKRIPAPYRRFDVLVLLAASAGLLSWTVAPGHPATAVLGIAAGLLHLVRLARWRGWLLREPDVLALHVGYLWMAVATLLWPCRRPAGARSRRCGGSPPPVDPAAGQRPACAPPRWPP